MRIAQDLNTFGEIIAHAQCPVDEKKYIFRVYHIRIIAKQIGSHDMNQTDSSIIIVRNVCVLSSASIFSSRGHDRQSSEQNNRRLISLHNNGEEDKHAHGFADF
jgi:hypothetical protein